MTKRSSTQDGPGTMKCVVSLRDGSVSPPKLSPHSDESGDWTEGDLEAALALAPALLGLETATPITLHGSKRSGPWVSPDQMYVDSLRRLHVVEIKHASPKYAEKATPVLQA